MLAHNSTPRVRKVVLFMSVSMRQSRIMGRNARMAFVFKTPWTVMGPLMASSGTDQPISGLPYIR